MTQEPRLPTKEYLWTFKATDEERRVAALILAECAEKPIRRITHSSDIVPAPTRRKGLQ